MALWSVAESEPASMKMARTVWSEAEEALRHGTRTERKEKNTRETEREREKRKEKKKNLELNKKKSARRLEEGGGRTQLEDGTLQPLSLERIPTGPQKCVKSDVCPSGQRSQTSI